MVKWSGQLEVCCRFRDRPRADIPAQAGIQSPMNQLDLKGRIAIVTGGAAGIGFAIARRLTASGARASLWDRDESLLAESAEALGGKTHTARVDVSDETDVKLAFDETVRELGRVDVLVCSAGITGPNLATWDYPVADWKQVLDIKGEVIR